MQEYKHIFLILTNSTDWISKAFSYFLLLALNQSRYKKILFDWNSGWLILLNMNCFPKTHCALYNGSIFGIKRLSSDEDSYHLNALSFQHFDINFWWNKVMHTLSRKNLFELEPTVRLRLINFVSFNDEIFSIRIKSFKKIILSDLNILCFPMSLYWFCRCRVFFVFFKIDRDLWLLLSFLLLVCLLYCDENFD